MKNAGEGCRQSGRENKMRMIASEHLDVMSEPSSNFAYAAAVTKNLRTHVRCSACESSLVVDHVDRDWLGDHKPSEASGQGKTQCARSRERVSLPASARQALRPGQEKLQDEG